MDITYIYIAIRERVQNEKRFYKNTFINISNDYINNYGTIYKIIISLNWTKLKSFSIIYYKNTNRRKVIYAKKLYGN